MPGKLGSGGPVPKPAAQRRRKPRPSDNTTTVQVAPAGDPTALIERMPSDEWHPIAKEWFTSLGRSGQAAFFEPSDWALARFGAMLMSEVAMSDRPSAQMVVSILQITSSLLSTEGDRRRLRLELARGPQIDADEVASVSAMDDYRRALSGD